MDTRVLPLSSKVQHLLRVPSSRRCLRGGHLSWFCRPCLFYSSCAISPTTLSLLRCFLQIATVMVTKKITGDELDARAKANGYKRGTHREEDSRRRWIAMCCKGALSTP